MGSDHLSGDQLLTAAYGVQDATGERHLAECPACAQAVERLREAGRLTRADTADGEPLNSLSDAFWQRQRAAVLATLERPAPKTRFRPALAFIAGMALLAAVGLALIRPLYSPRARAPQPIAERPTPGGDDPLLPAAFETANRVVPKALEPMSLVLPSEARARKTKAAQSEAATFVVFAGGTDVLFIADVTDKGQVQKKTRMD